MRSLKVIGHRGARGYSPENTIASFEKALMLGCEWIEFDVRVLEGIPIVIHDETVERTSNGVGSLTALGLAKVRSLDFGGGQTIPLLSEVLERFRGRIGLQIEIKGHTGEEEICRVIKDSLTGGFQPDDLLISAFDHRLLSRIKALLPGVRLGALTYGIPYDLAKCGQVLGCYSVHISREYATTEFVTDIKKKGLRAFCYTVNERTEAESLFQLGVDGVFSDYPDRLK